MSGQNVSRPKSGKSAPKWALRRPSANGADHASPKARRRTTATGWRQPRIITGCALMVGSIAVGAMVVGGADDRVMVWAASSELASGTVVTAGDLVAVPVALDQAGRYISASESEVVGRRLTRSVGEQELVAITAVSTGGVDRRLVTVPVEPVHAPVDLAHGNRVDVYSSPRDAATSGGASRLVLTGALVSEVSTDVDTARGERAVVLDVDVNQAEALINAIRSGVIDLVRVPVDAA